MNTVTRVIAVVLALAACSGASAQVVAGPVAAKRAGPVAAPAPAPAPSRSLIVSNIPQIDEFGNPVGLRQVITAARAPVQSKAGAIVPPLSTRPGAPKESATTGARALPAPPEVPGGEGEGRDPQTRGCVGLATVTPLANQITYGAAGPLVPTRLFVQIGGQEPVVLYSGTGDQIPLEVGNPAVEAQDVALEAGQEVRFIAESAYPNFDDPLAWVNFSIGSDDAVFAAVLTHDSNFFTIASQKGIQEVPFGMQESLQEILGTRVDWETGEMNLEPDEMIVLFELGASSPQSTAFDFNDLVLHVRTQCESSSEVVLRDSIGANTSLTEGNRITLVTQSGTSHGFVTAAFTAPQNVVLTEVSGIFASNTTNFNPSAFDYEIRVWRSHAEVLASPLNGTVAGDIQRITPTIWPAPEWGTVRSTTGVLRPAWRFVFDVDDPEGPAIQLEAGQSYVVAIAPRRSGSGSNGTLGIAESRETSETSDRVYSPGLPGGWAYLDAGPTSDWDGRVAMRIVGRAN